MPHAYMVLMQCEHKWHHAHIMPMNVNMNDVMPMWFNRSFTSKHTHPVDVWVKQGCTCCNAQMGDLNQNNNKNILWQKTQKT